MLQILCCKVYDGLIYVFVTNIYLCKLAITVLKVYCKQGIVIYANR